jgi:aldose 1-epimerase
VGRLVNRKVLITLCLCTGLTFSYAREIKQDTTQAKKLYSRDFESVIDGKKTGLYTLRNARGMQVSITNYGARIVQILVPDRNGNKVDVVLGFDDLQKYKDANSAYYGAIVGRYANRIANGSFTLHGKKFELDKNNAGLTLHGGANGFNKQVWQVKTVTDSTISLTYLSKDGEDGFPGNLNVEVTYQLTKKNELKLTYKAETDRETVINFTNHSFFNLDGEGSPTVFDHVLKINANKYLTLTEDKLPLNLEPITGTPFDFRVAGTVGEHFKQKSPQLDIAHGFDHTIVLDKKKSKWPAAIIYSPKTGIKMEFFTSEPAFQFFTANFFNGKDIGKSGHPYLPYTAFCLEAQHFPNSPNRPDFPSTVLLPGKIYKSSTVFKFSTIKKYKSISTIINPKL